MDVHVPVALIACFVSLMPFVGWWLGNLIDPPTGSFLPLPSFAGIAIFLLLAGLCWGGLVVWLVMR
ncbi:MAG TPA: hypothetical protein VHL34_24620 [Rhizomicrobium sp.]|jgi:hypothetical protein|nr:hypothetical protein [Rhizomicrobium sp.]